MELIKQIETALVNEATAAGREVSDDRFYSVSASHIQVTDNVWAIAIDYPEEVSGCSRDSGRITFDAATADIEGNYHLYASSHGIGLKYEGFADYPHMRMVLFIMVDAA